MAQYIGEIVGDNFGNEWKIKIGANAQDYRIYKNGEEQDNVMRIAISCGVDEVSTIEITTLDFETKRETIIAFPIKENRFIELQTLKDLIEK